MPEISQEQLQTAYDQFFQGNVQPMRDLCAEDFVLRIPAIDVTVTGRDRALEAVNQVIQQLKVRSLRVEKIEGHGEFLVSFVSGSSEIRGDFQGVDVTRLNDEGLCVESYLHRPPLPADVPVPAL
jgi:ketosteroid isomerase-like protein